MLSNNPDKVPEEDPLIVLDSKSAVSLTYNGKDIKYTRRIARRMHFVRNRKKLKMHKIDWCEVGLQLADINTNNVGDHGLTHRMKYIMVILNNWYRNIVQEGLQNIGKSI